MEPDKVKKADLVIFGGKIYTMNDEMPTAEVVAVHKDTIIYVGNEEGVKKYISQETDSIDLQGNTMYPGFIESHGHLMGLGYNKLKLDLSKANNFRELVDMVEEKIGEADSGMWIEGHGWHQSKWNTEPDRKVEGFPTHDALSKISPDNPVFLSHASGHAALVNAKAMAIAGINNSERKSTEGGEIIRDENDNPTGLLSEKAMSWVLQVMPDTDKKRDRQALRLAIDNCLQNGITGFHDAGVSNQTIDLYKSFKEQDSLRLRIYAMVRGEAAVNTWLDLGPEVDTSDHLLTIRAIKLMTDGALGNRGAWLLEPYNDMPDERGMNTISMDYVYEISKRAIENGFQVCSHAIGNRANRNVLDQYEKAFSTYPEKSKDHRFRIEHAQVVHPDDIPRFGKMGVIAAMQAIHLSSDMPWAIKRLGEERINKGAYAWQKLLQHGATVINGTDVPVEPVNPIACFYASVTRKNLDGTPENGYIPGQKMTREQALRSYTLDAAYGAFEENIKGSVEAGKLADFTVLDKDIITIPEDDILSTDVYMTILGGKIVYKKTMM